MSAVRQMGIDHLVWCVHGLDEPARLFEAMGFTLTPRAEHPWGTANRLVPLDRCFLELLEIGDPGRIPPHQPHHFSFGAFARDFAAKREGLAMLALQTSNARWLRDLLADRGLSDYAAFEFGRLATLPDGSRERLAFTLAFVTRIEMPELVLFACEQQDPGLFWRAVTRRHGNGGAELVEVIVAAPDPTSVVAPIARKLWGDGTPIEDDASGLVVQTSLGRVTVLTADALRERWPDCIWRNLPPSPMLVGMRLRIGDVQHAAAGLAGRWPVEQLDDGSLLVRPQDAFNVAIELEPGPLRATVDQKAEPLREDLEAVEPPVDVAVAGVERRRPRRR